MKKVLIGLLLIIPVLIVAAVLLITEVILITPDISVTGISIVDEDLFDVENVVIENFEASQTTYELFTDITPKKANNKKVYWTIEDSQAFDPEIDKIADVNESGLVRIYASGTFKVVVTTDDGNYKDSCFFTVRSDVARKAYIVYKGQKLENNDARITMATDEILALDACARPTDVDIEYIKWESSDNSVLTIDANGVIVPKKVGEATITMSIKSLDYHNSDTNVSVVAPVLTKTIIVNVTAGAFNMASYNLCSGDSVSLDTLGAVGATLTSDSSIAKIENGNLVFLTTGRAVLEKNGKILVINKYSTENKIIFENYELISGTTIIIGKIPYTLNCVYAKDGQNAEDVEYFSSNPDVADIDKNTGLITAKTEGEVKFTAQQRGGENIEITMFVKEPVIYFAIESDVKGGIANECIYGNMWYQDDLSITFNRAINIVSPTQLVGQNDMFTWAVSCEDNLATIDQMGVVTFKPFAEDRQVVVTVTATAKHSAYSCDKNVREYEFIVMNGINVTNVDEITEASQKKEYDIFVQKDIRFRTKERETLVSLYKDMYGNGHTIDWKHAGSVENKVTEEDTIGAYVIRAYGPKDNGSDYLLLRNVRARAAMLPDNGSIASDTFGTYCVNTYGRVYTQYCIIENAEYCLRMSGYEGRSKDDIPDNIVEGCIMSNSSKFTLFTWFEIPNRYVVCKNCVLGQSAIPSIGISSDEYTNSDGERVEVEGTFEIDGFCKIYNWKQSMNVDLIGNINDNEFINKALKNLITDALQDEYYQQRFVKANGIEYMHCGIMLSGFQHECHVNLIGDLEQNGLTSCEIDYAQLLEKYTSPTIGSAINGALGSLHKSYLYGYFGEVGQGAVPYYETLVQSEELYKQLREGDENYPTNW